MHALPLSERIPLAEKIRQQKYVIATAIVAEFYSLHPDWHRRYGARGRRLALEDAVYHLDFLASAIESGSLVPFEEYVRWTASLLSARGIRPEFLLVALRQIEQELIARLSAEEQALTSSWLQAGCQAVEASMTAADEPEPAELGGGLALTQRLFVQALLQGQRRPALTIIREALQQGHGNSVMYIEVLQAALYTVGRLWQTNQITVAQEHMATIIAQYVLAELYTRLDVPLATRGTVVLTGVKGELHQFGANMVADMLEADGWNVRFLGGNVPHSSILRAVRDHQANVLAISTTMLFNLPRVRRLIAEARAISAGTALRVLVGGAAFRHVPELYKEIGADDFAVDLHSTVSLLRM